MTKTTRIVIAAIVGAFVTVFAFPFLLHSQRANAQTVKETSWGAIKCLYGGCSSNTNTPPPPPPKT